MEWMPYVHDALKYIENNLLTIENPKEVADKVYISETCLQKGFQGITGYSVMEYIRKRRLYEASLEIVSSDVKITDIAYKYGYDSVDGFTRAFIRFHGLTPSAVKKKGYGYIKFPEISVDLVLNGKKQSPFRIMRKSRHRFIGFKREIVKNNALEQIQTFWDEIYNKYRLDNRDWNNASKQDKVVYENGIGEYGIVIDETENAFIYMIAGRQISTETPEEVDVLDIEEKEWAVFDFIQPVVEGANTLDVSVLEKTIHEESNYDPLPQLRIEWYESLDRNKDVDNYKSSIWIPVIERKIEKKRSINYFLKKTYTWIILAVLILAISFGFLLTRSRDKGKLNMKKMIGKEIDNNDYVSLDFDGVKYYRTSWESDDEVAEFVGEYLSEGIMFVQENDKRYDRYETGKPIGQTGIISKTVTIYRIDGVEQEYAVAVFSEDSGKYEIFYNPVFKSQ